MKKSFFISGIIILLIFIISSNSLGDNQWNYIGLGEGEVDAFAINPQTPETLYAGTDGYNGYNGVGMFKSTNGGMNWTAINITANRVFALAINPQTPETLYAGTYFFGVFKSTNGGTSWTAINTGLNPSYGFWVLTLAINPQIPETLYAGILYGGMFKSVNGGTSWTAMNIGPTATSVYDLEINPQTPETLYAKGSDGVFKSTNGGTSWTAINIDLTATSVYDLEINPQTPETLYAGTNGGVFKSTNGGTSWTAVNTGLTAYALTINPQTTETLYAVTEDGVFKSVNGGTSWTAMNTGLTATSVYALYINPQKPETLYAVTNGGVFKLISEGQGVIKLPRTGQTKCYNASGAEIPCSGTGQDGEYRAGKAWPNPRFVVTYCNVSIPCQNQSSDCDSDPSNDVVLDNLTGLMWARNANPFVNGLYWSGAVDSARSFNLCGYGGWHLPNVNELESLINLEQASSADWLSAQNFMSVQQHYWTSTTYNDDPRWKWVIYTWDHYVANTDAIYAGAHYFSWPVRKHDTGIVTILRTGQTQSYQAGDDGDLQSGMAWPDPRFYDQGNGVVTDNLTGLVWTKSANAPGPAVCVPAVGKSWQGALDYVKCLIANNYLGYNDWRLPNARELRSLIDYKGWNPSLPAGNPFENVGRQDGNISFYYWSSTSWAQDPSYALTLDMITGVVYRYGDHKSSNYSVWPVRGGTNIPSSDPRAQINYPGDPNNVFWFIHISDLHINEDNNQESQNLINLINISETYIEPKFIMATGDLTDDLLESTRGNDWIHYNEIINSPNFYSKYYDIPGNHDRYGDPDWNGYNQFSKVGAEGIDELVGQFFRHPEGFDEYAFIGLNTCDQEGHTFAYYTYANYPNIQYCVSDFPNLSSDDESPELDWLNGKLDAFRNGPNNKLVFLFGHHSINTDDAHDDCLLLDNLPGLFDARYDRFPYYPHVLADRGATRLVDLLNSKQVSVYAYGHTHDSSETWEVNLPGGMTSSALLVNTGSLGRKGDYRIFAIDNGGISTTTANINQFPVILITAPVDRDLGGLGRNPYVTKVLNSPNNIIRALVFNNSTSPLIVNAYVDDSAIPGPPTVVNNLYQWAWDASSFNPGSTPTIKVEVTPTGGSFSPLASSLTTSSSISVNVVSSNNVQYTLDLTKAGTGSGTITSAPAGINCGSNCSVSYTEGTIVTLTATPAEGSTFASWSGDCSNTGACAVTMNGNKAVAANFSKALEDTIYVSKDGLCSSHKPCFPNIQNGITSAFAPSIIKITQETFNEDVILDFDEGIALQGGWNSTFTAIQSNTTINGSLTISDGTLIIENIILQ